MSVECRPYKGREPDDKQIQRAKQIRLSRVPPFVRNCLHVGVAYIHIGTERYSTGETRTVSYFSVLVSYCPALFIKRHNDKSGNVLRQLPYP